MVRVEIHLNVICMLSECYLSINLNAWIALKDKILTSKLYRFNNDTQ